MRSLIVVVAVSVALGAAALAVNTQPARAAEVAATYRCEGNDLIVTVTDGDEPFTINAVSALGTTIITYIGYGPGDFLFATAGNLSNKFTSVTVTETGAGGDDQVLQLATEPIYCGAQQVAATYQCQGNDLLVTVTAGDEPFTINAVSALGTTIITYIGYGPGDFLFATAGNLSNKFTSVTVTETGAGGDAQVLQLATEPIYCGAQQIAATYQCQGNDLLVTVTAGDEPFTINAVSALGTTIIAYIGFGPGDFLFATAGNLSNKFTSVTVTETGAGGDAQVLQLATEPIYCGAQQVAATYQCHGNDLLVTVTAGDEPFTINAVSALGTTITAYIGFGPGDFLFATAGNLSNKFTSVTVTETGAGGDAQVLQLATTPIICGAQELTANYQCQGNDLLVTVTGGDTPFTVHVESVLGTEIVTYIGYPAGDFLFESEASDGDLANKFTTVTVTETGAGGDGQVLQLITDPVICGAHDLVASAQCDANELAVTVSDGDVPVYVHLDVHGEVITREAYLGEEMVFTNIRGKIVKVAVTEEGLGGDDESLDLGSFQCNPIVNRISEPNNLPATVATAAPTSTPTSAIPTATPTSTPPSTATPVAPTPTPTAPTDGGAVGDTDVTPTPRPPQTGAGMTSPESEGTRVWTVFGLTMALTGFGIVCGARATRRRR